MWYNIRIMSEKGEKTKTTLREDAEARPLYFSLIFLLLAAACILFPTDWLSKYIGEMLALGIVRFVFGAAGIWFIFALKRGECFRVGKIAIKNFDIVLVSVLIAVNNFPIIALCRGEAFVSAGAGEICKFVFFCVSVGFFEEIYFRGLIFPLLLVFFRGKKFAELKAVLFSGAIFGLIHLVNLFGGAGFGAVAVQVGYSTLNGLMYAALFLFTRSLILPMLCHTLFDVGGLMIERLGAGEIWNVPTIVLTAIFSVVAAAWIIFRFARAFCRKRKPEASVLSESEE